MNNGGLNPGYQNLNEEVVAIMIIVCKSFEETAIFVCELQEVLKPAKYPYDSASGGSGF